MQSLSAAAAQGPCTQSCQTDRDSRLRDQSQTQVVPDLSVLADESAAQPGASVLSNDTEEEVEHTDQQERCRSGLGRRTEQSTQIKGEAGAHKEQQHDWGTEVVQLFVQTFIITEIDIDRAHQHHSQQGRDLQQGTDTTEGKERSDADDQAVVGGMLFATSLGIFLIPVFFVITEWVASKLGFMKQEKKKRSIDYM